MAEHVAELLRCNSTPAGAGRAKPKPVVLGGAGRLAAGACPSKPGLTPLAAAKAASGALHPAGSEPQSPAKSSAMNHPTAQGQQFMPLAQQAPCVRAPLPQAAKAELLVAQPVQPAQPSRSTPSVQPAQPAQSSLPAQPMQPLTAPLASGIPQTGVKTADAAAVAKPQGGAAPTALPSWLMADLPALLAALCAWQVRRRVSRQVGGTKMRSYVSQFIC